MSTIWDRFRLNESEQPESVIETIKSGVVFTGTNLWVLIFAIFIASLGLNVNSPAVIIGAMLISPLMGPIMGMGLATAINDVFLLKKAILNYALATTVALATSTVYFLISPLNDAHSEILARTSPNVYDVVIALFGGFAGIVAVNSRNKGNVIPGVAIATALMPPLCTAGFGLGTLQWNFFFGAFYLFVINTVFIALATFVTVRLLNFPFVHLPNERARNRIRWMWLMVVIFTLLPSLYFGYDMVERNKFLKRATQFVETEAAFPNNYLLTKTIDAKNKTINLIFGGEEINENKIVELRQRMKGYGLEKASLEIKQGFSYLVEKTTDNTSELMTKVLVEKDAQIQRAKAKIDSNYVFERKKAVIFRELQALRPDVKFLIVSPAMTNDSISIQNYVVVSFASPLAKSEKRKIEQWLKTRLEDQNTRIFFQ